MDGRKHVLRPSSKVPEISDVDDLGCLNVFANDLDDMILWQERQGQ